jgi:hypothetical protein
MGMTIDKTGKNGASLYLIYFAASRNGDILLSSHCYNSLSVYGYHSLLYGRGSGAVNDSSS